MYPVVGDDDQPCSEAELSGQLAMHCEGWVGVCLDLELERRAGRRELEQLVEQQRALVAWSAVRVAEPA